MYWLWRLKSGGFIKRLFKELVWFFVKTPDLHFPYTEAIYFLKDSLYKVCRFERQEWIHLLKDSVYKASPGGSGRVAGSWSESASRSQHPESICFLKDSICKSSRSEPPASRSQPQNQYVPLRILLGRSSRSERPESILFFKILSIKFLLQKVGEWESGAVVRIR